jgi:hypothetical protein
VSAITVIAVNIVHARMTRLARISRTASTFSGSARSARRRTSAIASPTITASHTAVQTPMNSQMIDAMCCACGPCGSSADCHPAHPDSSKHRGIVIPASPVRTGPE